MKKNKILRAQHLFGIVAIIFLVVQLNIGTCNVLHRPLGISFESSQSVKNQKPLIDSSIIKVLKRYDDLSSTFYFLTTIKHKDQNGKLVQLNHAHALKDSGETVPEFAKRSNCSLAINASTMPSSSKGWVKPSGVQIINGQIIQDNPTTAFTLGIKKNNELFAFKPGTWATEMLKDSIYNALTAFVPLIVDHKTVDDDVLSIRKMFSEKHPRQVIAQFDNLDLLILSCGGRGYDGTGMTAEDLIRILQANGVKFAYMLDGGGSVSTVVNGTLITKKIDEMGRTDRYRPNFLYVKHQP